MRRLLPLFLLLFTLPALAGLFDDPAPRGVIDDAPLNNSSDFLPVREAFRLSLVSSDAQSVKLRFVAAEGYYLYRHQFKFRIEPSDLAKGEARLPAGKPKHDQYFGDVEVYYGITDVELPLDNPIDLPFVAEIKGVPLIGPLYADVISGHSILVYAAFAAVPLSWWILNRTRFGLRLRAAGENPAALDTAGVSVVRMRYSALIITGILCGLAGAYMATALQAGFGREMTAGRGYIALAALIFAKWRSLPALGATMLFGFFQALALRPDVVESVTSFKVSGSFLDALPYVLTVIAVAGFIGKSIPPRAGGEPYVKER